jgi:hypothetical protein
MGGVLAEQQWEYSRAAIAELGFTPEVPSTSLRGIQVGAFAEFFNVPYFSIITELRYTQRGRTVTVNEVVLANNPRGYIDLGPRDHAERSHFPAIAIMPKLRLEYETLAPFVALGPSLEFLISQPPIHTQFRTYELAISVAAGVEVSLGLGPKILAEARYTPSVTKAYSTERVTVQNSVAQFLLGLSF